jgi:hypothetical protein
MWRVCVDGLDFCMIFNATHIYNALTNLLYKAESQVPDLDA